MRLNVHDDFMDNSGVYAMAWTTSLPETTKPLAGHGKWSPLNFPMLSVSGYFIADLFDDSLVGEAVIGVIEHRDNQVFMDNDPHDLGCVDDSFGND